jgi:LemA protein
MSIELIIAVVVILGLIFYLISIYNKLISLKNRVDNGWAQIDVQLQRRYDLIPNLVETAKGYMKHEKETLKMVIDARNSANDAAKVASGNPSDQNAIKDLQASEQKLQGAMMSFQALAESYPDLKANTNMLALQEELATTENKVGFSRQAFNDAVMQYNTEIEVFPNSLIANQFRFAHATEWQIEDQEAKKNVKVTF